MKTLPTNSQRGFEGGRLPIGFEWGLSFGRPIHNLDGRQAERHTGAMAGEGNSTLTPRDEDEGLGAGFFLKIAGVCVGVGIIVMILALILWRAVYAWGFFGAFLALAAVLCLFGWFYDRRNQRT